MEWIFHQIKIRIIHFFFQNMQIGLLRRIAQVYEEELDASISHLVSLIEPSLVALLSIVIGGILLSVMLPLAGIMAGMS